MWDPAEPRKIYLSQQEFVLVKDHPKCILVLFVEVTNINDNRYSNRIGIIFNFNSLISNFLLGNRLFMYAFIYHDVC